MADITLEIQDIFDTPIHPPRRQLLDFVPALIRARLNTPPTNREVWFVKSTLLRRIAKGLYAEAVARAVGLKPTPPAGKHPAYDKELN